MEVSYDQLQGELDQLRADLARLAKENQDLRNRSFGGFSVRVSQKGAVSVYGINSIPVTLYAEPMLRLLDKADLIRKFIDENRSQLAVKPEGFQTIRDLAKERGHDTVAHVMLERSGQNTQDLKSLISNMIVKGSEKAVDRNQSPLPGMAATSVVNKPGKK